MSRSVSAPSSVTNTSPCWNGFIVPGSTFRYGSSFCMVTRSPRCLRRFPSEEAVSPLPSDEATPPVTNTCLVAKVLGSAATKESSRGSQCAARTLARPRGSSLPTPPGRPERHADSGRIRPVGGPGGAVLAGAAVGLLGERKDRGDHAGDPVDHVDGRDLPG